MVPNEIQPTAQSLISTESMASLTTSLVNEQREREKRQLNMILHNMPELTASESAARKKK